MKAFLISDHAKWCAKMMNGDKTIEIRKGTALYKAVKKLIDKYGYADFYVYCTKDTKNLLHKNCANIYWVEDKYFQNKNKKLGLETQPYINGKVIFKFRCYLVEEMKGGSFNQFDVDSGFYHLGAECPLYFERKSCLNQYELKRYLKGKQGYAIHISDLEIFDKPKEISEFYKYCKDEKCEYRKNHCSICYRPPLTKAPQSFMYIEVE